MSNTVLFSFFSKCIKKSGKLECYMCYVFKRPDHSQLLQFIKIVRKNIMKNVIKKSNRLIIFPVWPSIIPWLPKVALSHQNFGSLDLRYVFFKWSKTIYFAGKFLNIYPGGNSPHMPYEAVVTARSLTEIENGPHPMLKR